MAKKKDKNLRLIGFAVLGWAGYQFLQGQKQPTVITYPAPPAQAPQGSPAWLSWAQVILNTLPDLVTDIYDLWQPGGPFYTGQPATEAFDEFIFIYDGELDYSNLG